MILNRTRLLAVALLTALPLVIGAPASAAVPRGAPVCQTSSGGVGAAAAPVKVWLAGDSTMANGSQCPIGWGRQFAEFFTTDVTVVNSAVGGRSIQTWLYDPNVTTAKDSTGECIVTPRTFSSRWQAMLNSSTGMKAGDYLFIQFGINDSTSACPRHVGSARYQELLRLMIQAAKDRGANPILLTPVAAIICSGNTARGNRGFLTETRAVGTATGVPVIDLHQRSVDLYNSLRFCPHDDSDFTTGPVGAFFCNDHTHFEASGARQIAGVVARAVREQNIPLSSYLR